MRTRIAAIVLAVASAAAPAAFAHPGFDLSINGPSSVELGTPVTYSGRFTYMETAAIPGQTVELYVNGEAAGTTTTGVDGTWEIPVTFTTQGLKVLQAWGARGTPMEAPSWAIGVRTGEPEVVTAAITDVTATRVEGAVEVLIVMEGSVVRASGPVSGVPVDALFYVTAPQSCWTDTPCDYPYWEGWLFDAERTAADGTFRLEATIRFQSAGLADTCSALLIRATMFYDTTEIWDNRDQLVCL